MEQDSSFGLANNDLTENSLDSTLRFWPRSVDSTWIGPNSALSTTTTPTTPVNFGLTGPNSSITTRNG